jgi:hypothetical protein
MATIDTLSEQILRILGQRTDDKSIDIRDVKLNVKQSLAYVIRTRYFLSKQDDVAEIDGTLISVFKDKEVVKGSDGRYYTDLPCDIMSMPYGSGISFVSPTKDPTTHYKQVSFGFCDLYRGLDSYRLEGYNGFYTEEDRIYYVNLSDCENVETVRFGILVGVDNLNDDKKFQIPADMEYEVINEVLKVYGVWKPDDITNDSIDQV